MTAQKTHPFNNTVPDQNLDKHQDNLKNKKYSQYKEEHPQKNHLVAFYLVQALTNLGCSTVISIFYW